MGRTIGLSPECFQQFLLYFLKLFLCIYLFLNQIKTVAKSKQPIAMVAKIVRMGETTISPQRNFEMGKI